MRFIGRSLGMAAMIAAVFSPATFTNNKPAIMPELLQPAAIKQADNRSFGGGKAKNWFSRNKYSGADLRAIRARNGVGRPPKNK